MNDKFTIRDFLVYFLTGLFFLLTLLYQFKNSLFTFFSIDIQSIEKYSALYIFLLIPGLYLAGHIIQSIDYIILKFFILVRNYKDKRQNWFQKFIDSWLFRPFFNFSINQRINGRLKKANTNEDAFWQNCTKLITKSAYEKADYWNLMHTLFEGLTLITLFWCFYFLITFSLPQLLLCIVLTIIFWYRTKQMADNFIKTVKDTIAVL